MAHQCAGTKNNGERCGRQVSDDAVYCYAHEGQSEPHPDASDAPGAPAPAPAVNHRHAGRAVVR